MSDDKSTVTTRSEIYDDSDCSNEESREEKLIRHKSQSFSRTKSKKKIEAEESSEVKALSKVLSDLKTGDDKKIKELRKALQRAQGADKDKGKDTSANIMKYISRCGCSAAADIRVLEAAADVTEAWASSFRVQYYSVVFFHRVFREFGENDVKANSEIANRVLKIISAATARHATKTEYQVQAARAVDLLTNGTVAGVAPRLETLVGSGFIEGFVGGLGANPGGDTSYCTHVFSVLNLLCARSFEARVRTSSADGIAAAAAAMQHVAHRRHSRLQAAGCDLLRKIMLCDERLEEQLGKGLKAVFAAMLLHPDDLAVQENGALAISTVFANQEVYDDNFSPKILEIVTTALSTFPRSKKLQLCAKCLKREQDQRAKKAAKKAICTAEYVPRCSSHPPLVAPTAIPTMPTTATITGASSTSTTTTATAMPSPPSSPPTPTTKSGASGKPSPTTKPLSPLSKTLTLNPQTTGLMGSAATATTPSSLGDNNDLFYCDDCCVLQRMHRCFTCDGKFSSRKYCDFCWKNAHNGHTGASFFAFARCSTPPKDQPATSSSSSSSKFSRKESMARDISAKSGSIPKSQSVPLIEPLIATPAPPPPATFGPLEVSSSVLTFGLSKHKGAINKEYSESITLTNTSKVQRSFRVASHVSEKYVLTVSPATGVLPPGGSVALAFTFTFKCTTTFDARIPIVSSAKGPESAEPADPDTVTATLTCKIRSKNSMRIDPDEISLEKEPIGEGGYGIVYRGKYRAQSVAVKVLKDQEQDASKVYKKFLKEVELLEIMRHPAIVLFVGASYITGKLSIVSEYCPYGSLSSVFKSEYKAKMTYTAKLRCFFDIAQAMAYLHKSGIMHRDLKPGNALLVSFDTGSVMCKLTDFGLTCDLSVIDTPMVLARCGTFTYEAPEVFTLKAYDKSLDVFSYAMTIVHVITGSKPYKNQEFSNRYRKYNIILFYCVFICFVLYVYILFLCGLSKKIILISLTF